MEPLGILWAVGLFFGATSAASLGIVETEGGSVQGTNVRLRLFRSMDVFKGIPFAAKPGNFEKPEPHPGWTRTLKATRFAKRCLQKSLFQTSVLGGEDCLHLNIWVPHGLYVSSNLPVMLWFYGGAFMVGGSMGPNFLDNYLYSGQEIADRGDVIVVSAGYRVGTLGFLSSGDSELPGNYGLWDQHAAIAWVHRNIRSFGGDPDNITLFGESAGGASVSYQTLSLYNKGLVKRAISQSGVAVCPWAINRNPRKVTEAVAVTVGCPTDDKMVACLKSVSAKKLAMAAPLITQGSPDNPTLNTLTLSPVVDGDFIPDDPVRLFHNAADIDYLAGVNNMDGHMFTSKDIPAISKKEDISVDDVRNLLRSHTQDKGPAGLGAAWELYTSHWGPSPGQDRMKITAVDIGTDYYFLAATQRALSLHAATAKSGRTYSYLLSEPSLLIGPGRPLHYWVGADHADDLQYVFGKPFTTPKFYGDAQRQLSDYFISFWTNFARTGDPNVGKSKVPVTWPRFTSTEQKYLEINSNMDRTSVGQKMRSRFVDFWMAH